MSRAKVALDALVELGGGEQAGAAEVLAELFALEPELLREALTRVDWSIEMRAATRIAGPWHRGSQASRREDVLRGNQAAEILQVGRMGRMWRVTIYNYPAAPEMVGDLGSREEAEAAADAALTDSESYRVWHLLS